MTKFFEIRKKTKEFLRKYGLFDLVAEIYNTKWVLFRPINNFWAKKREKGYLDPKFAEIKKYENIHAGERCFILCTGPSLTVADIEKLKNEYTFSMNSIMAVYPQTDWRPTYYVINDVEAFARLEKDLNKYRPDPLFMSDNSARLVKPKIKATIYHTDLLFDNLFTGHDRIPKILFSGNAYATVYMGDTTTYLILQLAVYMGFKEIYLLGCDCDYSGEKKHVVDYNMSDWEITFNRHMSRQMATYEEAKKYADAHGIKIYNATRGGKLEVFERVDFDELMGQKKAEAEK